MNLKALATQLECQGVDPGYVQRFDWEKWILDSMESWETVERTEDFVRIRSLVLHLLQKYLKTVDPLYIQSLREDLDEARRREDGLERDLARARHEVGLFLEREKILREAIHTR